MTAAAAVAALLDEATAAARDPVRAVEALLAAWRLQPAPELAAAIDALTPRLPGPPHAITRRKHWLAVAAAGRAIDVAALVAALDLDWAPAQLVTTIAWPRDPRVSLAVAERLDRVPAADRDRVVDHLVEVGDPRTIAALVRHLGGDAPATRALRARVVATATLAPAAARALERYRAARAAHLATERALLAAVYAAPDDDEPRLVLGDWLQGHGDPRGELIALQFRRHRGRMSDTERERERALLAAYGRAWLDGLDVAGVKPLGYQRGFVDAISLYLHGELAPTMMTAPGWATVRAIRIEWLGELARPLFTVASMRSLRWLDLAPTSAIHWLLDSAVLPRLHHLRVKLLSPFHDAPDLARLLALGSALERLEVTTRWLGFTLAAGARPRSRLEIAVPASLEVSSSRVHANRVTSDLFPLLIDALPADALTELVVFTRPGDAAADAALDAALAPLLAAQRELATITYEPPR